MTLFIFFFIVTLFIDLSFHYILANNIRTNMFDILISYYFRLKYSSHLSGCFLLFLVFFGIELLGVLDYIVGLFNLDVHSFYFSDILEASESSNGQWKSN
jgi:hypothetical protein